MRLPCHASDNRPESLPDSEYKVYAMSWSKRILLVRVAGYASLILAIAGFSLGISIQHYALITVSFFASLIAFTVGMSANIAAELIYKWRVSLVRVASLLIFLIAIFGFSLGTNIQNSFIVTISFGLALISIAIGLNSTAVLKLFIRGRSRSFIGRG